MPIMSHFFQLHYCSRTCADAHFDSVHWAECAYLDKLVSDDIGFIALMVLRIMARTGIETVLQVANSKVDDLEAEVVYDGRDYRSVYLQVDHEDDREAGTIDPKR